MSTTLSRIRESALPRLADRVAGTPLLAAWGALHRRRPVPAAPRRFGLMMFETIGDTLLAATLVASLRHAIADAHVTVFCSRGNRGILPVIEGIADVVEVPLTRPFAALAAIRSVPVDVMIDIGQWPRWYAFLCAASRSRHTIGFATPGQARHYAFDSVVPHRDDVHELANFQALLAPLRVAARPPAEALRSLGETPAPVKPPGPYLVLHPWASGFRSRSREWPTERWCELAAHAGAQGLAVLVSGSPADRPRADALVAACPPGVQATSVAGALSLPELAAVLREAEAVVAVNTGVMHLAALLGARLVALHGPTRRLRWGPVGPHAIALAPAAGSCEFLHLGFEYPAGPVDCMEQIHVEEVWAAVASLVERR